MLGFVALTLRVSDSSEQYSQLHFLLHTILA